MELTKRQRLAIENAREAILFRLAEDYPDVEDGMTLFIVAVVQSFTNICHLSNQRLELVNDQLREAGLELVKTSRH